MATTKAVTALFSGTTFTAGTPHADSSTVTLDDGYGAVLHVKITNGGTGPTVALSLQIWVSADNSEFYKFGGEMVGSTTLSVVTSWGGIEIPAGVEYLYLASATTNTGQDVTVDSDLSEITAIS